MPLMEMYTPGCTKQKSTLWRRGRNTCRLLALVHRYSQPPLKILLQLRIHRLFQVHFTKLLSNSRSRRAFFFFVNVMDSKAVRLTDSHAVLHVTRC